MGTHSASLVFGHIELRLAERLLLVEGQPVALGSRGFDLLKALVSKRDRVVGKGELLDEVWPGLVVEENNLQVQISGLRRVLGAGAIATVAGLGYRFTLAPGPARESAHAAEAARQHGPAMDAATPAAATAVQGARVLVADDNKVNRLLLCRSLELLGHRVESAENGRQALDKLRQHSFDLLLLDLAMPELDGFDLLRLRSDDAALRRVSVIVTSSLGGVAPVARCIELGADDFLHKPVDPWLLKARVESSLARKQVADLQADTLRRLLPHPGSAPTAAQRLSAAVVLAACLNELEGLGAAQTPEETMALLSDWGTLMLDAVAGHHGELAQYRGDCLVALFAEASTALQAAHDMAEVQAGFNAERQAAGQTQVRFGVGIASGEVLLGTALPSGRVAQACIGAPVLLAQRLAQACAPLGLQLLMDLPTQAGLGERLRGVPVQLPGGGAACTAISG
ncbi:response regulator [Paucibacter soli]|uniref:response regulator n=1 Tax=Paucibacter soli TaxID=3133433 RepID=UPI0030A878F8